MFLENCNCPRARLWAVYRFVQDGTVARSFEWLGNYQALDARLALAAARRDWIPCGHGSLNLWAKAL